MRRRSHVRQSWQWRPRSRRRLRRPKRARKRAKARVSQRLWRRLRARAQACPRAHHRARPRATHRRWPHRQPSRDTRLRRRCRGAVRRLRAGAQLLPVGKEARRPHPFVRAVARLRVARCRSHRRVHPRGRSRILAPTRKSIRPRRPELTSRRAPPAADLLPPSWRPRRWPSFARRCRHPTPLLAWRRHGAAAVKAAEAASAAAAGVRPRLSPRASCGRTASVRAWMAPRAPTRAKCVSVWRPRALTRRSLGVRLCAPHRPRPSCSFAARPRCRRLSNKCAPVEAKWRSVRGASWQAASLGQRARASSDAFRGAW